MKRFVETTRFILRELVPEDVDAFFELDTDPEVLKYLGVKPLERKEQAMDIIQYVRRQYEENGIGRWAVEDKATGEFLGWAGLKFIKETINGQCDFYDVGYRLLRRHWGRGIASECAQASLAYGFEVLKAPEIYAYAHADNGASNRVLQKVGLRLVGTPEHEGMPLCWYKIEKAQWQLS